MYQIGIAGRNVESNIKKLKERGILIRHGSPKSGYWEIVDGKGLCKPSKMEIRMK